MDERLTLEELLGNERWLRSLARRLTGGVDADDAVQETWLVAAHAPPARGGSPRPWLATVLRNILRMRARAGGRRSLREQVDPGRTMSEPVDDIVERVQIERRLAELVLTLAEPLRTTVLLRYYEGLSAAAIARRLGVPAGTVRWRLKEGLDRLRRQLDEEHGSRRAWILWIAPMAKGAFIMKKLAVVIALILALLIGVTATTMRQRARATAATTATSSTSPTRAQRTFFGLVPATIRQEPSLADCRLEGRVLSLTTVSGLAGATLSFAGGGAIETTTSGADGNFRFTPAHEGVYEMISLSAPGHVALQAPPGEGFIRFVAAHGTRISDVTLFLEPIREVVATVVDEKQRPIAGATVHVDGGRPIEAPLHTDSAGQCRFSAVPGMIVEASSQGRVARVRMENPLISRGAVTLSLTGPVAVEKPLYGMVLDGSGRPLGDAIVETRGEAGTGSQVWRQTSSSAEGRFAFEPLTDGAYTVVARLPGLAPAMIRGVRPGAGEVVLRLATGGSLRGTVSRRGGSVTAFSITLESEDLERRSGDGEYQKAIFDADGRFLIDGIAPGSYRVQVRALGLAPSALQAATISAGGSSELRFVLGEGAHVKGRVVGPPEGGSQPIAGARVFYDLAEEDAVMTAADGSFDLAGIPPGIRAVQAAASGFRAHEVTGLRVTEDARLDGITIVLRRSADGEGEHLEFAGLGVLPDPQKDGFAIAEIDADGGGAIAGLRVGDVVIALDGISLAGREMMEMGNLLRGPVGTTLTVTYRRDGAVLTTVATRRKVQ